MDVRVGLKRKLSTKELMLLNCGVGDDLESPLDCKEIQPVHTKGNQSWIFIGRTDVEAETLMLKLNSRLWPPDVKSSLIWKDPDAGKDWRWKEKKTTEDEMVGWHHQHEFEQPSGVGEGQGSLAYCSPWGCKESDMTQLLNWIVMRQVQNNCKSTLVQKVKKWEAVTSTQQFWKELGVSSQDFPLQRQRMLLIRVCF